jgi:Ca-activated chloride channel family protein
MILALSGPQYGHRWEEAPGRGRDLIIALDCSKSMYAPDVPPSRMVAAKREIKDLLPFLRGERVGLVAFSGSAFLQCPLTADFSGLTLFLDSLDPSRMPRGGTNLAEALRVALEALPEKSGRSQAILLVTDAEDTEGDVAPVLEEARERNVPVFALGVGTAQGSTIPDPSRRGAPVRDASGNPVISRVNLPLLQEMARSTGGRAVASVPGDEDIKALIRGVRGTLETAEFDLAPRKVPIDRYQWFVGGSLFFLLGYLIFQRFFGDPGEGSKIWKMLGGTFLLAACLAGLLLSGNAEAGGRKTPVISPEQELAHLLEKQIENPKDPRLAYNIGNAYYRMERFEEAAASYESLFDGETPWEEISSEFAGAGWYNRGNALYRLGDLEEAAESYRKALELTPQDEEARKNLEFVLRQLEEQQKQEQEQEQQEQQGEQQSDQKDESGNTENSQDSQDSSETSEQPSGGASGEKETEQEKREGDDRQKKGNEKDPSEGVPRESDESKESKESQKSQETSQEPSHAKAESEAGAETREEDPPESGEESSRSLEAIPKGEENPESGDALPLPPPLEREVSRKEDPPDLQDLRAASEDQGASQSPAPSEKTVAPDMMERLLHRLRDMPGEALIPRGRYEPVEKDW